MSIAIIGAGGLGRIVANILRLNNQTTIEFYDDDETKSGTEVDGIRVNGKIVDIYKLTPSPSLIIGIGDINARKELYTKFKSEGFSFASAIHPTAIVAYSAKIEEGCIIKENAVIEIGTRIGANSIIGNGTVICHDCDIGKHCRIAPSVTIAGYAIIGEGCYLAVKVSVDRKIKIGENSVIASGCTIWKDVPSSVIVKLPEPMKIEERQL